MTSDWFRVRILIRYIYNTNKRILVKVKFNSERITYQRRGCEVPETMKY